MKINGYELNVSEDFLDDIFAHKTRTIELVNKDFPGYRNLTEGNKKALEHLVAAAKIFDDVAMEQDHEMNLPMKKALEEAAKTSTHAAKALRLFMSFHGVEGHNGIDLEPIEIFKGIKGNKGRNFYPSDLSVDEFHQIIARMISEGRIDEVRKILSVRTMVRRDGKDLKAIDYTEYFADAFSKAANELEVAAHYTTDDDFKDYLGWQAQALLQNNEDMDMLADKHWAVLQNDNQLEFTLGRESYDDELTATIYDNPELMKLINEHQIEVNPKDMLGVRVGIINREGTGLILKFKEHMPELAKLMPWADRYHQSVSDGEELKQTMVDVDLVALTGDYAQCRGAITTAQNCPTTTNCRLRPAAAIAMLTIARCANRLMSNATANCWRNWLHPNCTGILTSKRIIFSSSVTKTATRSGRTMNISARSACIAAPSKKKRPIRFQSLSCPNMSRPASLMGKR